MLGREQVRWRTSPKKRNVTTVLRFFTALESLQYGQPFDWSEHDLRQMLFACREFSRLRLLFKGTAQHRVLENFFTIADRYARAFQHVLPDAWKN